MLRAPPDCPEGDVRVPDPLEEAARQIVQDQTGYRLVYIDDSNDVDFCLSDGEARVGLLEVTRATDEDWRRLESQLKSFDPLKASIDGVWSLDLDGSRGPKDIQKSIDEISDLLRRLEAEDADHYPDSTRRNVEKTEAALADLGVPSGYRWTTEDHGLIYLSPKGLVSWMGNEHLPAAVSAAALANQGKLQNGQGDRHLFLWIEFHALAEFTEIAHGELPGVSPNLHDSVDVVWICQAHPLKGQEDLPLWVFEQGEWSELTAAVPEILLTIQ